MLEVPMCIQCKKPIDRNQENYVIVNKDTARYASDWQYAHAECQQKVLG